MREKALSWWNSLSEGEKRIKYADYFKVAFTEVHYDSMDDITLNVVEDIWKSIKEFNNVSACNLYMAFHATMTENYYANSFNGVVNKTDLKHSIMANLDPEIFIDEAIEKFAVLGSEGVKFAILETLKEKEISKKKLARTLRKWIKEIESRRFESLDDPKIQLYKVFKEVLEEIKNK